MLGTAELLLTVIPSIVWLLYRLLKLLNSPVETLVDNLNLEIPHIPQICIDAVTKLLVIIHWDIEVSDDEELIYVVLVNNRDAAIVNTTSCKLNHLLLNKTYQIEVLAINVATNFRSKSAPVYIETLLSDDFEVKLKNLPLQEYLSDEENRSRNIVGKNEDKTKSKNKNLIESSSSSSSSSHRSFVDQTSKLALMSQVLRSSSNNDGTQVPPHVLTVEQIKAIENPQDLNFYLLSYQEELQKVVKERENFQKSIDGELIQLKKALNGYKKEYNEESDLKIRLDSSIKDIEKKRDNLSFIKGKLQNQLKQLRSTSHLHESKLDSLKIEFEKQQAKLVNLKDREQIESNSLHLEQVKLKNEIEQYKKKNDNLDWEIKKLTTEKKKNEKLLSMIKPLMEMFGSESNFTREGTLKSNSQDAMNSLFDMIPEWKTDIIEELDKTRLTELEWRLVFKTEIRKYLAVKNNLELAKAARIQGYTPQKMNEYQASLEFGGYNHALLKLNSGNASGFKTKTIKNFGGALGKNGNTNFQISNPNPSNSSLSNANPSNSASLHPQILQDTGISSPAFTSSNLDMTSSLGGSGLDMIDSGINSSAGIANGDSGNNAGWYQYYGQMYSNDNSFEQQDSPADESGNSEMKISLSEPIQSIPQDSHGMGMNLNAPLLTDQYYNNYTQPLSNNLWNNNQPSSSGYVPLNSLSYNGNNDQFYGTGGNSSGNVGVSGVPGVSAGSVGLGPFGDIFQSSLNHSGTSFQSPNPTGGPNDIGSLRTHVLLQRLDMALQGQFGSYNGINSGASGLEGFLGGQSKGGPSFLEPANNNGSGLLHLPNASQPELVDSLELYSKSLSPQLGSLLLNKSNLWGATSYGHTRNLLNNSQIWRNDTLLELTVGISEINLLKKDSDDI